MAVTARLVGKLGGGSVEVIPVSASGAGSQVLATITVPAGETWLIAARVDVNSVNAYRSLSIGPDQGPEILKGSAGTIAGVSTVTGPATVDVTGNISLFASTSWDGTVYTTAM